MSASTQARSRFITLGAQSGAIPSPQRAQPANLLTVGDRAILIDAGAGVVQQLAKLGVSLTAVDALILTHLHFDHTGGLFGLLGLRFQVPGAGALVLTHNVLAQTPEAASLAISLIRQTYAGPMHVADDLEAF